MRILYKLTTRSRPQLAERAIRSVIDNSVSEDYRIWVTVDFEDRCDYSLISTLKNVCVCSAKETGSKISAINRDLDFIKDMEWDILVNLSDDQVFIMKGFDDMIRNQFEDYDVDGYEIDPDLDYFVHFPDGNRSDLCTMSIIGREYFNRDGYIYNPEYLTECCDDEAQEVAKLRGCYKFVNEHIFNHLHPAYGKSEWDSNYVENMTIDKQSKDRETLTKRRAINFGL